jgi:lipoate synthase
MERELTPIRIGIPNRSDTQELKLDHTDNLYKSCCGGFSDKRLITLLTQVGISALVLTFSGIMLGIGESDDKAIYMSLISSTMAFWLGKNEESR